MWWLLVVIVVLTGVGWAVVRAVQVASLNHELTPHEDRSTAPMRPVGDPDDPDTWLSVWHDQTRYGNLTRLSLTLRERGMLLRGGRARR